MTKNIPNENSSPIEWVKWDLQKTYEEYDVSDAIEGTYGHVFILKSNMSTRPTIAIKVALPGRIWCNYSPGRYIYYDASIDGFTRIRWSSII